MSFNRDAIQGQFVNIGGKLHAKSTLTDAQLKAAAAANPGILAPGWTIANGTISKGKVAGGGDPSAQEAADRARYDAQNNAAHAAAPAATPVTPAAPTLDQFGNYTDSTYFQSLADLRNQLGLTADPGPDGRLGTADDVLSSMAAQQKLAGLNQRIDPLTFKPVAAGGVGGQTMYDIMYGNQQKADAQNVSLSRSDAWKHGVASSTYNDQQLNNLGQQAAVAADGIMRQYGTDTNDSRSAAYAAKQAQDEAIRNYNAQQGGYAQAATQRGYEGAMNNYANTYKGYA